MYSKSPQKNNYANTQNQLITLTKMSVKWKLMSTNSANFSVKNQA